MVYVEKFIAVVKTGGKILREQGDVVQLPFGSEYELLLKNMNSRKANVNISIDDVDVLNRHSIVLDANSELTLEGFMNNDGTVKNRFKFIQKTEQIVEHRGDKIDDGMIRIEYAFEKEVVDVIERRTILHDHLYGWPYFYPFHHPYRISSVGTLRKMDAVFGATSKKLMSSSIGSSVSGSAGEKGYTSSINCCQSAPDIDKDEGITVKGSETEQEFKRAYISELEDPKVIILRLKGYKGKAKIQVPLLIKTKQACSSCGKKNKSSSKFCSDCGTYLESIIE